MNSFFGKNLPESLWKSSTLNLPSRLIEAHRGYLKLKNWTSEYSPKNSGDMGGKGADEAKGHFVNRFLNSAARMQYICADPDDLNVEVRNMVLDQLADGELFILDLAAGHGAGTLSMLALVSELRTNDLIPKLPVNVYITAVDYSADSLVIYSEMIAALSPWLETQGMSVTLNLTVCDLCLLAEFNEAMESFFNDAATKGVKRFFCVISALSGVGKEGVEPMLDSLKLAAAKLGHSSRASSLLWVDTKGEKSWLAAVCQSMIFTMKKKLFKFTYKQESFQVSSDGVTLNEPVKRKFQWLDPYLSENTNSWVCVMALRK